MQKAPNLHKSPDERARLQPLRKLTQKIPILAQLRGAVVSGKIWDTTASICGGSLLALGVLARFLCGWPCWTRRWVRRLAVLEQGTETSGGAGGCRPHLARSALLGGLEGYALQVRST